MTDEPVKLGERYRDSITGFEGVATIRSEFLYGCVRVLIEGAGDDGDPKEFSFDEQRLVVAATSEPVGTTARTGGQRHHAGRQATP